MMSISTVSAGAASSGYYKSEGYYAAGSEEGDAAAKWFGAKAEALGLEGRVDDALFTQMLEGVAFKPGKNGPEPDKLMGKIVDGERKHRPGVDLTFSAPKSVSIAALVYQDERLVQAHDKAVQKAMAYVETKIIQTRFYKNGTLEVQTGGKIIAGLFRHDTSRALDPQLHTHGVIANMMENATGNTTALHNDLIFRTQKLGSEIYRNELARGAMDAGYTVERVGKERLIELKEIPKELVETFSKRRAEMEAAMAGRGMKENPRTAELAALATRAAKHGNIDRDALQAGWLDEAKALGIDKAKIVETKSETAHRAATKLPGVTRAGSPPAPYLADAGAALEKSIAHISERNTSYSESDLLTTALVFAQKAGVTAITHAISSAKRNGTLIPITGLDGKSEMLTDEKTLASEREMTRAFRTGARTGDHAYALTTHDFQGATVDKIIIAMTANEQLATQKSFYVAASRARDDITLITDNPEKLAERLEAQTGEKINALEAYVEVEKARLLEKENEKPIATKDEKTNETQTTEDHDMAGPEKSNLKAEIADLQKLAQKQLGDYER